MLAISFNFKTSIKTVTVSFTDLETFAETKEDFMRKRSSGRIQRYFYDTKDKIRNSHLYLENISARQSLNSLLQNFYERLKRDEFFAYYFDRTCSKGAICDNSGLFVCQGLWNNDMCSYIAGDIESDHQINPYTSKEQRVIFCTWNLDHRLMLFISFYNKILSVLYNFFFNALR